MAISFQCGVCGRNLKGKDEHAGKRTKCPGCDTILEIPSSADLDDGQPYALEEPPAPAFRPIVPHSPNPNPNSFSMPAREPVFHAWNEPSQATSRSSKPRRNEEYVPLRSADDDGSSGSTPLREYVYCLLVLTLIPLIVSLLGKDDDDVKARIDKTIAAATPAERAKLIPMLNDEKVDKDQFLDAMPDHKIVGAHLAHDTKTHWLYGLVSAVCFIGLLAVLFQRESVNPLKLMGVGLFTGTVGILVLLVFQWCAGLRFTRIPLGKAAIIFLILKFIGWSYDSALDPNSGFLMSAFGFTFGVGLCEEICKAAPIMMALHSGTRIGWRGACLLGLASGVGFGVSEGIMYSGDMYNGVTGMDTYIIRFVSCVSLHAMWAGSVGMAAYRRQDELQNADDVGGFMLSALRVIAIPMALHGFYDTLLKKDMNEFALLVALLSFGYFAFQVETSRGFDGYEQRRKLHA